MMEGAESAQEKNSPNSFQGGVGYVGDICHSERLG